MTKKQLEKEAEETSKKAFCIAHTHEDELIFKNGYLAGAEPREKRIEELEQENAELKRHIKADCIDCADYIKNKSFEKENAELKKKLKEKLKTIADKDLSFVAKFDALEKENAELVKTAETFQTTAYKSSVLLTKAKEIIEKLLNAFAGNDFFEEEELSAMAEAEQFLKEIEK